MGFVPCLVHSAEAAGGDRIRLGHPLPDAFLEFVAGRARWNTVLATAFDLKVFFSIIDTDPAAVTPADVLAFIQRQREPRRDRAMVEAMLLGGLRRCEVVGLRLEDLRPGDKRVFIAEGKGGHQRIVPLSSRFFISVAAYLEIERPRPSSTDRVFVVLKGPRRGQPLTAAGVDEIVTGARTRAGLARLTCHQLRHTCFTRLREAGMALEAIQAQAGHRSIESTRIYLHLANDWLAGEYRRAAEAIDAQATPSV